MRKKKVLSLFLAIVMVFSVMIVPGTSALGAQQATTTDIGDVTDQTEDGNILIFQVGGHGRRTRSTIWYRKMSGTRWKKP